MRQDVRATLFFSSIKHCRDTVVPSHSKCQMFYFNFFLLRKPKKKLKFSIVMYTYILVIKCSLTTFFCRGVVANNFNDNKS